MSKEIFQTFSGTRHARVIEDKFVYVVEYFYHGKKKFDNMLLKHANTEIDDQKQNAIDMAKRYTTDCI